VMSLNINGLREEGRRRNIFYWLKQLNYDVILLQDVRCHEADQGLWSLEWGLPVLWSYHNAVLLMNKSMTLVKVNLPQILERCLVGAIQCPGVQGEVVVGSCYIPADQVA
jgi:exonuclease III